MTDDGVRAALVAERLELCEFLRSLEDHDWDIPSLCAEWTVLDVIAHLTLSTRTTSLDFVKGMIRHRGDFDEMNAAQARDRAGEFAPEQLVGQLQIDARSTKKSLGSSHADGLIDVIVHGQDICQPLGRTLSTPPERVVLALDHVITSRWYPARKAFRNATVTASDIDWTKGSGSETIGGSAIDLLLAGTGRTSALDRLTGSGIGRLRTHLAQ